MCQRNSMKISQSLLSIFLSIVVYISWSNVLFIRNISSRMIESWIELNQSELFILISSINFHSKMTSESLEVIQITLNDGYFSLTQILFESTSRQTEVCCTIAVTYPFIGKQFFEQKFQHVMVRAEMNGKVDIFNKMELKVSSSWTKRMCKLIQSQSLHSIFEQSRSSHKTFGSSVIKSKLTNKCPIYLLTQGQYH